ncbi:hypothetical protein SARC_17851 [Sphaeroforma arctica JP610]|uniref:Uncharacterized protein n=1 Tax=Sphaeroforma arctica JP610 TaxID=667725 RepID=A0A0L0EYT3_9EUKA|nr:hypothetical protein SARC_17851 [Sphaeroforma arctica JP610]KNC69635.1 hypothetical protein SARC_17851 [Sphaeroforma arctica JP610]|eukprot:XP_014143537.1 hypothetical protein SARC_17851 [Sphaeroforma arctica JP610]
MDDKAAAIAFAKEQQAIAEKAVEEAAQVVESSKQKVARAETEAVRSKAAVAESRKEKVVPTPETPEKTPDVTTGV